MNLSPDEFLQRIAEHRGMIGKVSRIYFEQAEDQQDLAQEIVLQCWKSLASFNGDSEFSTWLYRIALNTAIVFFKKDKRHKTHVTGGMPVSVAAEDHQGERSEDLKRFYQGVYQLNSIEKAIVLMYVDGLSGREISQRLDMSEGNVRVKLSRVKQKLRKTIGDIDEHE